MVSETTVDITWLNGMRHLSNSDARVTISPLSGSLLSYMSNLTIFPLSTADNNFICKARARPPVRQQSFVTVSEEGERMIAVPIEGKGYILCNSSFLYRSEVLAMCTISPHTAPSPPTVSIVHSSSSVMAGQPLTLTCSASLQQGIVGSPTLLWTRDGVDQPGEASSDSLSLSFSPLLTSHGGVYTCTARLTIPDARVDVTGTNMTTITVQSTLWLTLSAV